MKPDRPPLGRQTLDGAFLVMLAEALMLPSGLLTAGVLARRLQADGFGLYSLAVSTVVWLEWTMVAFFARAVIKLIGDAADWRPLGSAVVRLMGLLGLALGGLLWLAAEPLAAAFGEPRLAGPLRLLALDVPLFSLAQAHRLILIGLGRYKPRAWGAAARWLGRMAAVVAAVELGFGLEGAAVGILLASALELAVQRIFVQPPWRPRRPVHLGPLWQYSLPLFLSAFSLRFYDRVDLLALKALGGTAEQAGLYGAAQRLALIPATVLLSLTPLLLSAVTHALAAADLRTAQALGRQALRAAFAMLPLAAAVAGAGGEVVALAFGPGYEAAVPLLAPLLLAAQGILVIAVCTSVLIAHGRPRLNLALTGPLLPLAAVGYVLLVPRWGPAGAALATLLTAGLGALLCLAAARRLGVLSPPWETLLRAAVVGAAVFLLARWWPAPGLLVLVKLAALAVAVALGFVLAGEFKAAELGQAWAYARRPLAIFGREAGGA